MPISLKHAYEEPASGDGYRVLVDRLWPRGLAKEKIKIDEWLKNAAPSDQLRKRFHNEELSWAEFRNAYLAELKSHREELRRVAAKAKKDRITLVFSTRNKERNNALVLKQYLKMLGAP